MHINHWREIKNNKLGRAGMVMFSLILFLALFAPILTAYPPDQYSGAIFNPPSVRHWLGTDDVGQDIWAGLLYGSRTSLLVCCGTSALALGLSLLAGGSAALAGGWYDRLLMRVVDALLIIPPVILIILTAAYIKPGILVLIFLLSVFFWPSGTRIIRAQALSLKSSTHVAAATNFGARKTYLLLRHIIPELGPVAIAVAVQFARRAVFMEAGLSFLGVSDPTVISWGKMMQNALEFTYLKVWIWWLLPTGLALSMTIMGLTFTGTALEAVLNPRLRKEAKHAGN